VISLSAFVLIYIALGVADVVLMMRYSRRGLEHADSEIAEASRETQVPALTY
jgi:cytochrome bd-type quinol oxidase subunit 1